MSLTRENYYDYGDKHNLVLSNSALSTITQSQGGSFLKFERFFEQDQDKKDSLSLEKGKLLHKWLEIGDEKFHAMRVEKPSAKLGDVADIILNLVEDEVSEGNIVGYNDIGIDVKLQAATEAEYGQSYKQETLISKIDSCKNYINEVIQNKDRIGITVSQLETLTKCKESIDDNYQFQHFIDTWYKDDSIEVVDQEVPITGEIGNYTFKILIDVLSANRLNDKLYIKIVDYKTTGYPVDLFMGSYKPRFDRQANIVYEHKGGSFLNYRTYRQLGIYAQVIRQWTIKNFPDVPTENIEVDAYLVVVETSGLYESRFIEVSREYLIAGLNETYDILKEVAEYERWRDAQEARVPSGS